MIQDKAIIHQKQIEDKLEILAAFYGSKLEIQVYVEEYKVFETCRG